MATRRVETEEWKLERERQREARAEDMRRADAARVAAHIADVSDRPEHVRADRAKLVTLGGTVLFEGASATAYEYADIWNRAERLVFVENLR